MRQRITDDSDLRKYRIELPNMVDDEMDPFQARLYLHYKRVCGANGGKCFESVRTTANKTKMSNEKVIDARQWLSDNGWVSLEQGSKNIYNVTITDRWIENFTRYIPNATIRDTEQSPFGISNATVRNSERAPLDISKQRKNLIKKEPIKNAREDLDPYTQPDANTHHRNASPPPPITAFVLEEDFDPPADKQPRVEVSKPVGRKRPTPPIPPSPRYDPRKFNRGLIAAGEGETPVEVYYESFSINDDDARLDALAEDDLTKICTDLDRLREVCTLYRQHGHYKRGNLKLILDWYRDGTPTQQKKGSTNAKTQRTVASAGSDRQREYNERYTALYGREVRRELTAEQSAEQWRKLEAEYPGFQYRKL